MTTHRPSPAAPAAAHAAAPWPPEVAGHVHGIDLLRFLAATAVLLFHFKSFGLYAPGYQATGPDAAFAFLPDWAASGWVGVQVFFVLSGYVIARSTLGASWQGFLIKRAVRIFPALWICASIALLVRIASGEPVLERLLDWSRSVVLSPKGPYIDGVVWTLVIEAIFYALVGLTMARGPRQGGGYTASLDRLAVVLGSASGLFLVFCTVAVATAAGSAAALDWFGYKLLLLRHGVFFALGMALFAATRSPPSLPRQAFIVGLVLLCLLEIRLKALTDGDSDVATAAGLWLFMLAWLMLSVTRRPPVTRAGLRALLVQLGRLSYPLYLGHFVVGMYLVPPLAQVIDDRAALLAASLLIVATLALLVAHGPEPWGQQRLRALLQRIGPARPSPQPSYPRENT